MGSGQSTASPPIVNPKQKCSVNEVIHSYVKYDSYQTNIHGEDYITKPDFTDKHQNLARYRALVGTRRWIWSQLPPDVEWYKCQVTLIKDGIDKYITPRFPVADPPEADNSESNWLDGIILFGHTTEKTIVIAGSDRYSTWKAYGPDTLTTIIYIGLSPSNFRWFTDDVQVKYFEFDPGQAWKTISPDELKAMIEPKSDTQGEGPTPEDDTQEEGPTPEDDTQEETPNPEDDTQEEGPTQETISPDELKADIKSTLDNREETPDADPEDDDWETVEPGSDN